MSVIIQDVYGGRRPGTGDVLTIRRYSCPDDPADVPEYVINTYNDCVRLDDPDFRRMIAQINEYLDAHQGASQ